MTDTVSENFELAVLLPLGVVVNQLLRTEAHLRLVNMKTLDLAKQCSIERFAGPVAARLEQIRDTLDSIRGLVADIETDVLPGSENAVRFVSDPVSDDEYASLDGLNAKRPNRKSQSDWDD